MGLKISKAEFDALPDALKARFTSEGDAFALVEEDVEGLKKSKADILAEKKAQADEAKLKEAGAFKELEEKLRAKIAEVERAGAEKEAALLNTVKRERLTNELIKRGVLPERAKYALGDIESAVELVADENGFNFKAKGGIGDAKEIETLFEGLKANSPFFFAATNQAGSGAVGNQGGGGAGAKTIKRTDFDALPPVERMARIKEGAQLID